MPTATKTVKRVARPRRDDQRGLVIVYMAMMLVVLMIAAAFTVDVGAWYERASQLQRAADAAAMAGVVYLPDNPTTAVATAVATATKNGFTSGGNISVTAAQVPGKPRQLRVDISDGHLAQYFSQTFYNGTSASRHAIAEYAPPIPMGSPENGIGMGNLYPSNTTSMWAAVDGWCNPREQGDLVLAHTDGQYVSNDWTCPSTGTPPDLYASSYNPAGYSYTVHVPSGRTYPLVIEAWDPAFVPVAYTPSSVCTGGPDIAATPARPNNSYSIETDYSVVWPDGTTHLKPFVSTENGFGQPAPHGDSADCQTWVTLDTIPTSAAAGDYTVTVATKQGEANSFGSNAFALEAVYQVGGVVQHLQRCSTIAAVNATYTSPASPCPQMYAVGALSVKATPANDTTDNIYLAKIDGFHKGATMTIQLWDPGDEGGNGVRIVDNAGNTPAFTYTVSSPCTSSCSGSVASGGWLDINNTGTQSPNRKGTVVFNDRMVTLTVPISSSYDATANDGWWQVAYDPGNGAHKTITDRTTWKVSVTGNPVHLVGG